MFLILAVWNNLLKFEQQIEKSGKHVALFFKKMHASLKCVSLQHLETFSFHDLQKSKCKDDVITGNNSVISWKTSRRLKKKQDGGSGEDCYSMSAINAATLAHEGGMTGSSGRRFQKASYCRQWEMKFSLSMRLDFVNIWMFTEKNPIVINLKMTLELLLLNLY